MEDAKLGRPIGRKLQLVLLIPVLLGIIVCTVIVITIIFISQSSWVEDTKSYLISKEKEYMKVYSRSISSNLESVLGNQWYYLNFLTQTYSKSSAGEIQASSNVKTPKYINSYEVPQDSDFPDTTRAEWLTGKSGQVEGFLDSLQITDPFLRIIQMESNISLQLGYIFSESDQDLMYVYPVQNMSFINKKYNYEDTCGKTESNFSPTCSDTFALIKTEGMKLVPYYEAERLLIMNSFDSGAGVSVLNESFLAESVADDGDFKSFACFYQGNWTLYVSGEEVKDFAGKDVATALYKDSNTGKKDFFEHVVSKFDETEGVLNKVIDSESTYIAFNRMNLSVFQQYEDSYVVGVMRTKSSILKDWEGFIDKLLKLSIVQACVFGIFLIVSLVVAWFLSLLISGRVTRPIDAITSYLNKADPPLYSIPTTFNSQINSIIENLRKIETIEKFINPSFLMHPLLKVRLQNLETAASLFREIDNKRGLSIALNMIGNLKFHKHKYAEAEDFYRQALTAVESLLGEINFQEKEEYGLSDNDKTKLSLKRDNYKDSWSDERRLVEEAISEKLQQICMAMVARLRECNLEATIVEMRGKWKEVIRIQTRILQFYENSRSNYVKYLRLLLDMAECYETLQYFHTAGELLDIVHEELWKIDVEKKTEVDIDVNRLRKIGISIVETEKLTHFKVDNLTFEKDVLMQRMFYRRGVIALDNNSYHKAAMDFTQALEYGRYFDPVVREDSVKQLYNLFVRFGMEGLVPELTSLHQSMTSPKKNIIVILGYDLRTNPKLSTQLTKLTSSLFTGSNVRVGGISRNSRLKTMQLCERDFPGLDLENLMIQCKNGEDNENLIDSMHRAIEMLNQSNADLSAQTHFIVLYKKDSDSPAIGSLETLASKLQKNIEIMLLALGEAFSLEFEIFLENNLGEVLDCKDKDLLAHEEKIRKLLKI